MHPLPNDTIRRILVIQIRAIGDVVLTTPVLPILKKHFPQAEIDFLTGRGIGSLLRGLPEITQVLEMTPYAPIPEVQKIVRAVRQRHYDLVIDYQGTNTPALITVLSGAPFRLGWARVRRRWAYNLRGSARSTEQYVPLQKCQLMNAIGITEENTRPRIALLPEAQEKARNYLNTTIGEGKGPKINISVAGKRQARRWFPDRWAQTIDLLQEELGAQVFLNAAGAERDYVEQVAAMCRHRPHILPSWDLATFAAYLAEVDLHLSYDNGVKHLAVALGTPSLAFYGSARPEHWHPPDDAQHQFLYPDVACKGCGRIYCGAMTCMETIQPAAVLKIVTNMITRNRTVMA